MAPTGRTGRTTAAGRSTWPRPAPPSPTFCGPGLVPDSEGGSAPVEVILERRETVLTITLNRPDVLNAFDDAMHEALRGALAEAADSGVRAVVITGAGRGFCVGQDVSAFDGVEAIDDLLRRTYHQNILALRALRKPVIAAVNGAAAGA